MYKTANFLLLTALLLAAPLAVAQQDAPDIAILGADNGLARNIRSHLRISGESCDAPLARLERLRSQVQDNVQRAARALGYYRLTATTQFSREAACWRLDLTVDPGERILVDEVSIYLSDDPLVLEVFRETLDELPLLGGQPLNHGEYEALKNALSASAVELGYIGARFDTAEIRLDLAAYEADIVIDFDPGERYRFGEIRVLPVPGFSQAFIESMISLRAGEPYSSDALLEQRVYLGDLQYFSRISISPQLSGASNQTVPVVIELTPRFRHSWSTGIGYTTDTGPRARASYDNRYINTRGHSLDAETTISKIRSHVDLGYSIPLSDPLTQSLRFATGFITEDTESYESDRWKLEGAFHRDSISDWQQTYFVDFLRDDFVLDQQADAITLTMLGFSLSKTSGDDLINPTRGWHLFGELRGANDALLSDTSFAQLHASGKGIVSVGKGRFISRLELGTTLIDDVEDLPASVRYFAGGDQSIRGYDYQSLGPVNENGEVIGGKSIVVGSVEFDYPVRNNWRAAVFYDGGNAFSSDQLDWKDSVGVGVRWLSPIGPIRVDVAHALDDEGGFQLHVTMGPDL